MNTYTGDGSTTAFTLSQAPDSEDNIIAFIEGVYQNPNDFILNGTTLTFDVAPANSRKIVVYHVKGAVAGQNLTISTMTGDGSDTTLTLSIDPISENNVQVYIDGVYQNKDTFSVSGTTLTFSEAPPNGSKVEAMTLTQTDINTATLLTDADGDTKIQVEESSDEDKIRFDTGGTERVIIDSTGVGIGTTSPSETLHVKRADGTALIVESSNDQNNTGDRINIEFRTDAAQGIAKIIGGKEGNYQSAGARSGYLAFQTINANSYSERMRIDSSGVVNIGTASGTQPSYFNSYLNVQNNASTSSNSSITITAGSAGYAGLHFGDSDNGRIGQVSYNNSDNSLLFTANNSERMRIDSSGNVGIGTATIANDSDHKKLKISGASGTGAGIIEFADGSNNIDGAIFSDDGNLFIVADRDNATGSSSIRFRVDGSSEKMRIDSSGNVGIGTTSPADILHLVNAAPILKVEATNNSSGLRVDCIGQSTGQAFRVLKDLSTTLFTVDISGNVTAAGSISDERLKEDISLINNPLDKIKQIKGITYKLKESGYIGTGLIAQDLQKVLPEAVYEVNEPEKNDESYLAINYGNTVGLLVESIKEQQTLIETLQAKVEALENG